MLITNLTTMTSTIDTKEANYSLKNAEEGGAPFKIHVAGPFLLVGSENLTISQN